MLTCLCSVNDVLGLMMFHILWIVFHLISFIHLHTEMVAGQPCKASCPPGFSVSHTKEAGWTGSCVISGHPASPPEPNRVQATWERNTMCMDVWAELVAHTLESSVTCCSVQRRCCSRVTFYISSYKNIWFWITKNYIASRYSTNILHILRQMQ